MLLHWCSLFLMLVNNSQTWPCQHCARSRAVHRRTCQPVHHQHSKRSAGRLLHRADGRLKHRSSPGQVPDLDCTRANMSPIIRTKSILHGPCTSMCMSASTTAPHRMSGGGLANCGPLISKAGSNARARGLPSKLDINRSPPATTSLRPENNGKSLLCSTQKIQNDPRWTPLPARRCPRTRPGRCAAAAAPRVPTGRDGPRPRPRRPHGCAVRLGSGSCERASPRGVHRRLRAASPASPNPSTSRSHQITRHGLARRGRGGPRAARGARRGRGRRAVGRAGGRGMAGRGRREWRSGGGGGAAHTTEGGLGCYPIPSGTDPRSVLDR